MVPKKRRIWNKRNPGGRGIGTYRRECSSMLNISGNSNRGGFSETTGFDNLELFEL